MRVAPLILLCCTFAVIIAVKDSKQRTEPSGYWYTKERNEYSSVYRPKTSRKENLEEDSYCYLFDMKSDVVTFADWKKKIATAPRSWFVLYGYEQNSPSTYGKCRHRWHQPDKDGIFFRQTSCYNRNQTKCEVFNHYMKLSEDECGRVEGKQVNGTGITQFYSQDLDTYIWFWVCYLPDKTNSFCGCGLGYLDLLLNEERLGSSGCEWNVQGLPWHLIAADLKTISGFEMSDQRVIQLWQGPDCHLVDNRNG